MRLVGRIPAGLGRVERITLRLIYDGEVGSDGVDVTDVQLQPGEPSGVVPHPSDLAIRPGGQQWRNGIVTRSTDEVIILANSDRAAPTRIDVEPSGTGSVRIGSFRFGRLIGPSWADGESLQAPRGWGRLPVLTERSDGHVLAEIDHPTHLTIGWTDRR